MAINLDTIRANADLNTLQAIITQKEALGFELITLARGVVGGQPSNTATFRIRSTAGSPGPLTLVEMAGTKSLPQQETDVNSGETSGKKLISYAAALVQGNETNVAAYRG
jgi:hypothetical protein